MRSLPRGCLTCGSSTHSFKDCRRYRQMTDTQQVPYMSVILEFGTLSCNYRKIDSRCSMFLDACHGSTCMSALEC